MLEFFGRKCLMAWDDFCASVKCLAKPSITGPNRLAGRDQGIKEGNLVSVLDFHSKSAISGAQAPPDWPEHRRVPARLVHVGEEFGLEDLEIHYRV